MRMQHNHPLAAIIGEPERQPVTASRRPLLAVSLKMYFSLAQTYDWMQSIVKAVRERQATNALDISVFPTYLALEKCQHITLGSGIGLGGQDVFWEDQGAYTGEVSPMNLKELGCGWVEVGHAERRRQFCETDVIIAAKARAGHRNGLQPVVCIGEVEQAGAGAAASQCLMQARSVLRELPGDASIVFAYEPVWAIGADRPATSEHVRDVLHVLRAHLPDDNNRLRFIYGGSAGPGLYKELSDTVDGLFLGRSAHDPRAFAEVLDEMLSVSRHAEVNAERASETPRKQHP